MDKALYLHRLGNLYVCVIDLGRRSKEEAEPKSIPINLTLFRGTGISISLFLDSHYPSVCCPILFDFIV